MLRIGNDDIQSICDKGNFDRRLVGAEWDRHPGQHSRRQPDNTLQLAFYRFVPFTPIPQRQKQYPFRSETPVVALHPGIYDRLELADLNTGQRR